MKRLALLAGVLLAAIGCSNPTAPSDATAAKAARAANAKAQLQGGSKPDAPGRLAAN